MSTEVIVYILTALAAVVVVLTRLRLARDDGGAGQFRISHLLLNAHVVTGSIALVVWLVFLVLPEDSAAGGPVVGIVALAFWWITAILGLLILMRWMPAKGKHATTATQDTWSEGPGLSILAHVGLVVGVLVFTFAYLTAAV
jgi:hypothetical protein